MPIKLKNLIFSLKHSHIPILVTIVLISCWIFNADIESYFIYDKNAIALGEIWRLFTAHLLHTNGYHLLLNLAGLWLLWLLHSKFYTRLNYLVLLCFTALITSLGLFSFSPLTYYVGLSGVLHGVFAFGACKDIIHKDKTGYLLLIGLFIKLIHEQFFGASEEIVKLINANVAIDAHLYGAIAGLGFFFICKKTKI